MKLSKVSLIMPLLTAAFLFAALPAAAADKDEPRAGRQKRHRLLGNI